MAWSERYVDAAAAGGGDGTTAATSGANGAWTLAEATAAAVAGQRVNIKGGTYANGATSVSLNAAGTTTQPVWWRGYSATIGDLDNDPVTAKPLLTFTTGALSLTGSHQIVSNLNVNGARTTGQFAITGTNCKVDRCRAENTNAIAGAAAVTIAAVNAHVTRCWFKATSSATRVVGLTAANVQLQGCTVQGGIAGVDSSTTVYMFQCTIRGCSGPGYQAITTGSIAVIDQCTFRGCGGDGVRFDVLPTTYCVVRNCLFASVGGYGIRNNTGTATNVVSRLGNYFYACTSGPENGFGDSPSLSQTVEPSTDPHTSSTDLTLVTGSSALAAAQPGAFEGESYTSYLDAGAVQKASAGGGGVFVIDDDEG
jgi:hypothetical protein